MPYRDGVKSLPDGLETSALIAPLARGWGLDVETIEYAPVGVGSYHWVATDRDGTRVFVTVDDLDQKAWLGDTRASVFDGLTHSLASAVAVRDAGCDFVVAPILTGDGAAVRRLGDRHAIAVYPFIDGQAGRQFEYGTAEERAAVMSMLARLHQATPAAETIARRSDLALSGRKGLESALQELDSPWSGGPFAEPARIALADHADEIVELLGLLDRLRSHVAASSSPWVVTHGEPHPVNVMRTAMGHALIDWDTVALAPPERDLWMVVGRDGTGADAYVDAGGRRPDPIALDLFRLTWELADIASYASVLRAPHRHNEDTAFAYDTLTKCVAVRDHWAALLA